MSRAHGSSDADGEQVVDEYVLDVRILAEPAADGDGRRYRFEAPGHEPTAFPDPESARLYADVYFDVNGFAEADTGSRGIPPAIVVAGRDTLAAYLLTRPDVDVDWVASYLGVEPDKIERFVAWVRSRAEKIRAGVRERGIE